MATYQVVPYLISVKPKGSSGAETLNLDNIDGNHKKLVDQIANTLAGSKKLEPFALPASLDTTYVLSQVRKSPHTIFFTVTQGSRGIKSKIVDGRTVVLKRESKHIENIEYRNVMIFPDRGKYAVLLTERIGTRGVASFLHKLLVETLRHNLADTTAEFKVLTTAADLQAVNLTIGSMEFNFPTPADPSGKRMDLNKADGRFSLKYKFFAEKKLSKYLDSSGKKLDPAKIFGVLAPPMQRAGLQNPGAALGELGVTTDIHVTLPSGQKRTFTMGADEGPALTYKLEALDTSGKIVEQYPSVKDFLRVASAAVSDVSGTLGITDGSVAYCERPSSGADHVVPEEWKVVWNVPSHIAPSAS